MVNRNDIIGGDHLVDQETCNNNVKSMSDKIDNLGEKLGNFEIKITKIIAEMPLILRREFDSIYASKSTEDEVKGVKNDVKDLKEKGNNRLWEFFKYAIELLVALGVAYIAIAK